MRERVALGLSLAVAALLAFGLTQSAARSVNILSPAVYGLPGAVSHPADEPHVRSTSTLFADLVMMGWDEWTITRGFEPLTHVEQFATFYLHCLWLFGPLVSFGIFSLISRRTIWRGLLWPLSIAGILAIAPHAWLLTRFFLVLGIAGAEAARCMFVVALMIWSMRLVQPSSMPDAAVKQAA